MSKQEHLAGTHEIGGGTLIRYLLHVFPGKT